MSKRVLTLGVLLLACQTLAGSYTSSRVRIVVLAPVVGGQDFATRCAQPGVIKCIGFDAQSDFNIGSGGLNGAYGANAGILPPSDTSDYSRATRDTSLKASGDSSLRFTIPANSGADTSGAYFTNFSNDLSVQFDGNQEFYVQWRQRFTTEYISTAYAGGGGFKSIIVGTGDQPERTYASCEALTLVQTNYLQNGFPTMYNSCTGSTSHGPYDNFFEEFVNDQGGIDYKLQNARPAPGCTYLGKNTGYFPPGGSCMGYVPNEWMTFQMHVQLGSRVGDEFKMSHVTLSVAREGRASELIINWGPYNVTAGPPAENQRYGKVWLLPYNTGRDPTPTYVTTYTWYDELIVSTQQIADPT